VDCEVDLAPSHPTPPPHSLSLLWSIYSAQRFNKLPSSPPPLSCSLAAEVTDFVRQVRCSSHRFFGFVSNIIIIIIMRRRKRRRSKERRNDVCPAIRK